jgi:hypothetical protein
MSNSFEDLLKEVIDNPESLNNKDLSEKEILELYKRLNPLNDVPSNRNKSVLLSIVNTNEVYNKRFLMTSLIGYLFQAQKEFKSVNVKEFNIINNEITNEEYDTKEPMHIDLIVTKLEQLLETAKVLQEAYLQSRLKPVDSNIINLNEESKLETPVSASTALETTISEAPMPELDTEYYNSEFYKLHVDIDYFSKNVLKGMFVAGKNAGIKVKPNSTLKISSEVSRVIIKDFLLQNFNYDPTIHVRPFSDKINYDIYGEKVNTVNTNLMKLKSSVTRPDARFKSDVDLILSNNNNWHTVCYLLDNPDLGEAYLTAKANLDEFKPYLYTSTVETQPALEYIPPADAFYSYNMYINSNYDELRRITEELYAERLSVENLVRAWDTFEGTESELSDKYRKYVEEYQNNINTDVLNITVGEWTVIAPFRKNRQNIDMFNKNNDVLKKILDNNTQDKKIGEAMLKKRITKQKAENIREAGVDGSNLDSYKSALTTTLNSEEKLRLEKSRGNLNAYQKLETIDKLTNRIKELEEKNTPYTESELSELDKCRKSLIYNRELLTLEDGEVRLDIFVNKSGVIENRNVVVEEGCNFINKE